MSTPDCFWDPFAPGCCDGVPCPVDTTPAEMPMAGGDHEESGEMDDMMGAPWAANLVYLFIALGMTTRAGLNLWRYENGIRQVADFVEYDIAVLLKTNWWKQGWYLSRYGDLAIFGVAFISQLLALFGVAIAFNMSVWVWGVGVAGALVNLVAGIEWFLAYNKMHTEENETVKANVERMWMEQSIVNSAMGLLAYEWGMPWMMANMPKDKKSEMKEDMEMFSLIKLVAF